MPCISSLRVFGKAYIEEADKSSNVKVKLKGDLDFAVEWDKSENIVGFNVLWGHAKEKLYHSIMVLGDNQISIGALVKGQNLFVRSEERRVGKECR